MFDGCYRAARNCELFAPALMAPRGNALYTLLYICLSWLATVWIVYERVKTILKSPGTS
jgi:hypothetical protein